MNGRTPAPAMVTSPHAEASACGAAVLAAGGNAVEAALTTVAALGVAYPHFCGVGGDAFFLIAEAGGAVHAVSGIGQAALACEGYPPHQPIPVRGGRSALTTAGAVDAMAQAFAIGQGMGQSGESQQRRRLAWADLWAPAIALARDGYALSDSERFWLEFRRSERQALAGIYAEYADAGNGPESTVQRRPQLAATLQQLASQGPRAFYEGPLAERLARGLAAAGSPLTTTDLAATRARRETPLRMAYRGGTLLAHPPPTQGLTTLGIMGILNRFALSEWEEGSADYYHLLVESVKRAFLDRNQWLADPEFSRVPLERLLSAPHLNAQAAAIDMQRAMPWPAPLQTGDTVFVGAVDAQGNAVSALATVYFDWGSGVLAGDTGVLWHNRGAAFSTDPAHPNALQPGKRPFHTLNPGIYLRDGKVQLVYGTQGADGQPQTLAAVLSRLIDYQLPPWEALARPRFLLGRTFSDGRDTLKLEADVPAAVQATLAARGHAIQSVPAQSPLLGHPGALARDAATGLWCGAHDPRSDGVALGAWPVT